MNQNNSIAKNRQGAKRIKLNRQRDENEIQSSDIFKLPVEILEYIFDYLSLQELNTVSETCKSLQRVTANCYRKNYFGLSPSFEEEEEEMINRIYTHRRRSDVYMNNFFIKVVDKIMIFDSCKLKGFFSRNWEFHELKKLIIKTPTIPNIKVRLKGMRKILCNLEYLQICSEIKDLSEPIICDSHLENLLSLTPNIKHFYLRNPVTGSEWLNRKYPMLEHCIIRYLPTYMAFSRDTYVSLPITTFLELSSNIHSFGIHSRILWENRDSMKASQIKLENLKIFINQEYDMDEKLQSLCNLLNDFHHLGLYKRLSLACIDTFNYIRLEQKYVDQMENLNALVYLEIGGYTHYSEYITLSKLKQLEEISICDSIFIKDLESIAKSLKHLKRIHFVRSNLKHVMLFISKTSNLREMKVEWFLNKDENIAFHQIIDLSALNKERAKLLNATDVTLYVEERVYLATKRTKRETDLSFIKLKRTESIDWDFRLYTPNYPNYKLFRGTMTKWFETGEKLIITDY